MTRNAFDFRVAVVYCGPVKAIDCMGLLGDSASYTHIEGRREEQFPVQRRGELLFGHPYAEAKCLGVAISLRTQDTFRYSLEEENEICT